MKTSTVLAVSLIALLAHPAPAQQLPTLVAKVYPGAVDRNTNAGKAVACNLGEDHHDPFCFLTRDPIEKVREFYAKEGVKLDAIPVKKDQNTAGDGLYDLEEAARLQLSREEIGALYAAPVEFWRAHSSVDEVSYFNTVVVIAGKTTGRLQGSPQANKAAIQEDPIFGMFVLRPETAAMMNDTYELSVDPERLVPLYNKHLALQGMFFRKEGHDDYVREALQKARVKRAVDSMKGNNSALFKTQDNKTKAIDAFLGEIEKESYSTLILIQKPRKDGITRDPATLEKEWRSAMRFRRSK
jgi:hypothetical protein